MKRRTVPPESSKTFIKKSARFTEAELEKLSTCCLAPKSELLANELYNFTDNGAETLGVAHMDTFYKQDFDIKKDPESGRVYSPSLDNRIGLFTMKYYLPLNYPDINFDILLTDCEEMGRSTISQFVPRKKYRFAFSFDDLGRDTSLKFKTPSFELLANKYFNIVPFRYSDLYDAGHLVCPVIDVGSGIKNIHFPDCNVNPIVYRIQIERFARFYREFLSVSTAEKHAQEDVKT